MKRYTEYKKTTANERRLGQKITLFIANSCYILAVLSAINVLYLGSENTTTPLFASFLAITVFFICVGFLLSILGSGHLPSLQIDENPDKPI